MKTSNRFKPLLAKILKFGSVGILNTLVDTALFSLLVLIPDFPAFIAQICGYLAGCVNSYLLNRRFTFKSHEKVNYAEILKFALTSLISLAVSTWIVWLLSDNLGYNKIPVKLAAIGATQFINFLSYYFWVFKEKNRKK